MRPLHASLRESDRIRARRPEAEPIHLPGGDFPKCHVVQRWCGCKKEKPTPMDSGQRGINYKDIGAPSPRTEDTA